MYTCNKCNKGFKFDSELNRHKNRKIQCNESKKEYKCDICNVAFKCPTEQQRHKKTKKHITNSNIEVKDIKNNEQIDFNKLQIDFNKLQINFDKLQIEFDKLTNENAKLVNENNLLKSNMNKNVDHSEYIYIIHERTFVELNANIYKIGKTKNIKNRLNGYSKGSKLLFTIPCNDCSRMETIILNYLKSNNNYIQAKEYGNEYFICDLNILINDIHTLVKNN